MRYLCGAFLAPSGFLSLGQQIRKRRIELKKNRKQLVHELGVSAKTLRGWETSRCQPGAVRQSELWNSSSL
jgi:transcriptional regulator with XRE-family HTH domain